MEELAHEGQNADRKPDSPKQGGRSPKDTEPPFPQDT